jgi:hypothetical protein
MTQQNAGLVEETASASEEMSNQAQELLSLMERFKIHEDMKSTMRAIPAGNGGKKSENSVKKILKETRGIKKKEFGTDFQPVESSGEKEIEKLLAEEGFDKF